jgi:hypothetical protein
MEIIGARQGIRFVAASEREPQIEQLLNHYRRRPSNAHMRFDTLPDPDFTGSGT